MTVALAPTGDPYNTTTTLIIHISVTIRKLYAFDGYFTLTR